LNGIASTSLDDFHRHMLPSLTTGSVQNASECVRGPSLLVDDLAHVLLGNRQFNDQRVSTLKLLGRL
jgi:hypothetical protein